MKTLNDLADKLEKMANNIDKKVIEAQQKTAQQIFRDVIITAPFGETGNYIDSIKVEPTKIENNVISTFIGSGLMVGPTKSGGKFYNLGYLLEHGTNAHHIYPVDSNCLVFMIDGEIVFAKHVFHPGMIAHPHYSFAIEKNKEFYKHNIKLAWRDK